MTAQALGQQDHIWTLETRRLFPQLPLPERRRQFAEPAKLTAEPSADASEDQERAVWQGVDSAEE